MIGLEEDDENTQTLGKTSKRFWFSVASLKQLMKGHCVNVHKGAPGELCKSAGFIEIEGDNVIFKSTEWINKPTPKAIITKAWTEIPTAGGPEGETKQCPECGKHQAKKAWKKMGDCYNCGYKETPHKDHNSSTMWPHEPKTQEGHGNYYFTGLSSGPNKTENWGWK